MTAFEIVSTVLGTLGFLGGVAGILMGNAATKKAEQAQADASAALTRSAAASEESAAALHRANELAEAALPKATPQFAVRHVSGDLYGVFNDGTGPALDALVSGAGTAPGKIRPKESTPRHLDPGDSITFFRMPTMGPAPRIQITWTDPTSLKEQTLERDVHKA